jgi:hypothetical protein
MTKQNLVVSNDQKTANKKVQLVFHKPKGIDAYLLNNLSIHTRRDFFQLFCVVTSEVVEWFDDFTIHSIEVWINSIIQTEHETKLIVEGKEEGGLRAILSPKTSQLHTKSLGQSTNYHLSRTDSD